MEMSGCLLGPTGELISHFHVSPKPGCPPVLAATVLICGVCRQQRVAVIPCGVSLPCWNACLKWSKLGNAPHLILSKAR